MKFSVFTFNLTKFIKCSSTPKKIKPNSCLFEKKNAKFLFLTRKNQCDRTHTDRTFSEMEEPALASSELTSQVEEPVPFVEGWHFIRTLGEGAFGQVRLAISNEGQKVAVKIINLQQHPTCKSAVDKEVNIHRRLQHENIIVFYGDRYDDNQTVRYLFLEYVHGSELYDKIDPDRGMPYKQSRSIFKQILKAVQFIHSRGFTHRDIKPENILVTEHDIVKIIDFGLATVFRYKGQTRKLNKRCGTPPYLAPEVLSGKPFDAEPAEVWSCGVVLVAMLAGELPWSEASTESDDWNAWIDKNPELESRTPWTKIDLDSLVFIRKILQAKSHKRSTIEKLLKHRWMDEDTQTFKSQNLNNISKRLLHRKDSRITI